MFWQKFKRYYVYTYLDDNNNPYYIGMGSNNRVIAKHLYVKVPDWGKIEVIDNLSQIEAWKLEIEIISKYGRKCNGSGILENLASGGETQKSGWHHSEDTKRRISEGNKGKIRTPEQRKNYKWKRTKEHCEIIRQANIGRPPDGRQLKGAIKQRLKKWFNNGKITRMFEPGKEINGFVRGRLSWKETR